MSLRSALVTLATELELDRSRLVAKIRIVNETPSLQSAGLQHEQGMIDLVVEALARRSADPIDDDERFRLRLVTQAAVGAMRAALDRWAATGATDDLADIATSALDDLAAGFGRAQSGAG